jgi:U2 small nuclear ribonucleoprotein A'
VRAAEKTEAAALFGGADGAKRAQALAADSKAAALKEYAAASLISDAPRTSAPSQQQMLALKAAIAAAATLDEVHRLEKALASGVMPELAGDGDAAMQEG